MTYTLLKAVLPIAIGLSALACGSPERTYAPAASGSGGTGGSSGSSGAGGQKDASVDVGGSGGSGVHPDAGDSGVLEDGGFEGGADATDDVDAGPPPPPPPPGRPGTAIVSGGLKMSSTNYQAVVVSGEAPGFNGVISSPNYKLHGGVVGTTQRK